MDKCEDCGISDIVSESYIGCEHWLYYEGSEKPALIVRSPDKALCINCILKIINSRKRLVKG